MDGRLTGIMNLAFHPGTCEGEAVAAFLAARRLAGARGIDAIVAAPVVKEVVKGRCRDRVVTYAQTIPVRWQHDYMLTILQAARRWDLDIDMHELGTVDNRVIGAMTLRFAVAGSLRGVEAFTQLVEEYFAEMRRKL
jgi:hypothetical protein